MRQCAAGHPDVALGGGQLSADLMPIVLAIHMMHSRGADRAAECRPRPPIVRVGADDAMHGRPDACMGA